MASEEKGPQVNWVAATGSGLGSVTSAVLLSTTGAAGTWVGAGIGTFIITVGGAIYAYYLQRAKTGIEKTSEKIKLTRGSSTRNSSQQNTQTITAQRDPAHEARSEPPSETAEDKTKPTFKEILRGVRWKRVAAWAAGLFAITMVIVFIFELATGRPVSSYTGGTSPDSTGTSLTGVTDPARESPDQAPPQDGVEIEQPQEAPLEEVPLEEGPQPVPDVPEEEAPAPVEPEPQPVPEQQAPQQQAPQQQEAPVEVPE